MAGLVFVTLGLSWLLCCCTQAQPPPLDAICDSNGRCTWHGSGWYRGCVSDIPVLTFNQFNDGGLLDLRCSEVQVLSIESSTLTCADMKAHVYKPATWFSGIDADGVTNSISHFTNDTDKDANLVMKLNVFNDKEDLCLYAVKNIQPREEIQYNYGDKEILWWRSKMAQREENAAEVLD
uniref:SET domain-containing protein n=1 Tax=Magallana gigas TaxID=29159 RepID=K1PTF3_MAGGI